MNKLNIKIQTYISESGKMTNVSLFPQSDGETCMVWQTLVISASTLLCQTELLLSNTFFHSHFLYCLLFRCSEKPLQSAVRIVFPLVIEYNFIASHRGQKSHKNHAFYAELVLFQNAVSSISFKIIFWPLQLAIDFHVKKSIENGTSVGMGQSGSSYETKICGNILCSNPDLAAAV